MDAASAKVMVRAALGLLQLIILLGLALFVPAGTLRFIEAWVFLGRSATRRF
jgi:hypothetical protein